MNHRLLLLLLLTACTDDPADTPVDTDTDASSDSDDTDASALPASIQDVFPDPGCDGGDNPTGGVGKGEDLHRILLDEYPDAVCNDGSPGLMYIRAAHTVENANRWVFWMQGGSQCADNAGCRARWCGTQAPYTAGKMSSNYTNEVIVGSGLFHRDEANALADANQVFLYYCSSDSWAGTKSDVVLEDVSGVEPAYTLQFRGRSIVEAAFAELADGATSDDGDETVPALSSASEVLLTGTSAGSAGLTRNADWMVEQLPSDASVRAIFDASFEPDVSTIADTELATAIDEAMTQRYEATFALRAPYTDQSCLAAHPTDPHMCGRMTHIRLNHVEVPFFQNMDLADSNALSGFRTLDPDLATEDYAAWQAATLALLPDLPTTAEDPVTEVPGYFSQGCGKHTALNQDDWFFKATIDDDVGDAHSLHDAIEAWLAGEGTSLVDTVPPTSSVCPP